MNVLEDRTSRTNALTEEISIIEWAELEKLIGKGCTGDDRALRQLDESIDLMVFSEKYMSMVHSELI